MSRVLSGLVIIDGTDDEWWPESDEHVHKQYPVHMVMDFNQPAAAVDIPDVKWGGECRVETRLSAVVVGTGQVQVEGNVKLFEGVTESSDDLEDTKVVSLLVPKGGHTASTTIQLRNTETWGGDHAEVYFHLTNVLYEDE